VAFGEDYRPIPVSQLDLHAFSHAAPASRNAVAESATG
jgi:hypothetical protein